jgi:hypothetical protein
MTAPNWKCTKCIINNTVYIFFFVNCLKSIFQLSSAHPSISFSTISKVAMEFSSQKKCSCLCNCSPITIDFKLSIYQITARRQCNDSSHISFQMVQLFQREVDFRNIFPTSYYVITCPVMEAIFNVESEPNEEFVRRQSIDDSCIVSVQSDMLVSENFFFHFQPIRS